MEFKIIKTPTPIKEKLTKVTKTKSNKNIQDLSFLSKIPNVTKQINNVIIYVKECYKDRKIETLQDLLLLEKLDNEGILAIVPPLYKTFVEDFKIKTNVYVGDTVRIDDFYRPNNIEDKNYKVERLVLKAISGEMSIIVAYLNDNNFYLTHTLIKIKDD